MKVDMPLNKRKTNQSYLITDPAHCYLNPVIRLFRQRGPIIGWLYLPSEG